MAFEKLLILESTWANEEEYIADSRSTSKIYQSLESLLSLHKEPVNIIQRPLLASRFVKDIEQFVSLPANRKGPNIIVISAHGSHKKVLKQNKQKHRRIISAIDGNINLSRKIRKVSNKLNRTIIILDACEIGEKVASFRKAAKALGVIGFSGNADWIDSSIFILALLMKFQEKGVFQMKRISVANPFKVLSSMKEGVYKKLMEKLDVDFSFKDNYRLAGNT